MDNSIDQCVINLCFDDEDSATIGTKDDEDTQKTYLTKSVEGGRSSKNTADVRNDSEDHIENLSSSFTQNSTNAESRKRSSGNSSPPLNGSKRRLSLPGKQINDTTGNGTQNDCPQSTTGGKLRSSFHSHLAEETSDIYIPNRLAYETNCPLPSDSKRNDVEILRVTKAQKLTETNLKTQPSAVLRLLKEYEIKKQCYTQEKSKNILNVHSIEAGVRPDTTNGISKTSATTSKQSQLKKCNNDCEMTERNTKFCALCNSKPNDITNHYKRRHKCESYVSRLTWSELDKLRINTPFAKQLPRTDSQPVRYTVLCSFCDGKLEEPFMNLYSHYASHTGEYGFQCAACQFDKPFMADIESHQLRSKKCRNSEIQIMYRYRPNTMPIYLHYCNICNFVQLNEENIFKHLSEHHDPRKSTPENVQKCILAATSDGTESNNNETQPAISQTISSDDTQGVEMNKLVPETETPVVTNAEIDTNNISSCSKYRPYPPNVSYLGLYKCVTGDCFYSSDSAEEFVKHLEDHKQENLSEDQLPCPYCTTIISAGSSQYVHQLVDHIRMQHSHLLFQCSKCCYRSCDASNVSIHQKENHSSKFRHCKIYKCHGTELSIDGIGENESVRKATCPYCLNFSHSTVFLMQHIISEHKTENQERIKRYSCIYCLFCDNDQRVTRKHLALKHPGEPPFLRDHTVEENVFRNSEIFCLGQQVRVIEVPATYDTVPKEISAQNKDIESIDATKLKHKWLVPTVLKTLLLKKYPKNVLTPKLRKKCFFENCNICTTSDKSFFSHVRSNHVLSGTIFQCCKCDFRLENSLCMDDVLNHIKQHLDTSFFMCGACSNHYLCRSKISEHIRSEHAARDVPIVKLLGGQFLYATIAIVFSNERLTFSTMRNCFCCEERNMKADAFILHLKIHHRLVLNYFCEWCNSPIDSLQSVETHFRQNHTTNKLKLRCELASKANLSILSVNELQIQISDNFGDQADVVVKEDPDSDDSVIIVEDDDILV